MVGEISQNDLQYLKDMVYRGKMTTAEANIEMVRMQRFLVVTKLPKEVRDNFNRAVKNGLLKHRKRDGLLPEIYYHPEFEYLADAERRRVASDAINAIKKVLC